MEEMLKLQTTYGSNNRSQSTNSSLAMHQNSSHVISSSEFKPKIRIVHIFAPEIIKTDVANFRELVQRLTGKPTDRIGGGKKRRRSSTISSSDESSKEEMNLCKKPASTKTTVELCNGFRGSSYLVDHHHHHQQQRIKDEEEEEDNLWRDGLGDIDGFIQGLTHEYPFLPLMTSSSSSNSHLDAVFGTDTYLNLAN